VHSLAAKASRPDSPGQRFSEANTPHKRCDTQRANAWIASRPIGQRMALPSLALPQQFPLHIKEAKNKLKFSMPRLSSFFFAESWMQTQLACSQTTTSKFLSRTLQVTAAVSTTGKGQSSVMLPITAEESHKMQSQASEMHHCSGLWYAPLLPLTVLRWKMRWKNADLLLCHLSSVFPCIPPTSLFSSHLKHVWKDESR